MLKPATLLALLCTLAACSSDPKDDPQATGKSGVETAPSEPSTVLPTAQTPTPTTPDTTAAAMTPQADTNTTTPAATPEEAAPPPEP